MENHFSMPAFFSSSSWMPRTFWYASLMSRTCSQKASICAASTSFSPKKPNLLSVAQGVRGRHARMATHTHILALSHAQYTHKYVRLRAGLLEGGASILLRHKALDGLGLRDFLAADVEDRHAPHVDVVRARRLGSISLLRQSAVTRGQASHGENGAHDARAGASERAKTPASGALTWRVLTGFAKFDISMGYRESSYSAPLMCSM